LVEDRRTGKNILYRLNPAGVGSLLPVLREGAAEIPEAQKDLRALELVLKKRQDKMRSYFDELAGKFGRHYVPGRSWKALADALLHLLPPVVVADLGAGEGTMSQLLARRARQVIAIDNSEKMVDFGKALAAEHGLENLDFRKGDLEELPIESDSVDVALFSQSLHHAQHPAKAVEEASRILRPNGRILVLDLLRHQFEEAREMYADVWLGFTEVELDGFLRQAGFENVQTSIVDRGRETPNFATVLAVGDKV